MGNAYKDFFECNLLEVKREGVEELLEYLKENGFFEAPASTKYHLAEEGGLCRHSVNVLDNMMLLDEERDLGLDTESLIICGLLHDICKVDMYKKKADGSGWEYNTEGVWPMGHGEKSVIMILKYMDLTDEEMLAIRWHMGGFDDAFRGGSRDMNEAMKRSKLVALLHIADMMATHLDEE